MMFSVYFNAICCKQEEVLNFFSTYFYYFCLLLILYKVLLIISLTFNLKKVALNEKDISYFYPGCIFIEIKFFMVVMQYTTLKNIYTQYIHFTYT